MFVFCLPAAIPDMRERCSRGQGAAKERGGRNKQERRIKSERPGQGAGAVFTVWEKGYRDSLCPSHTLRGEREARVGFRTRSCPPCQVAKTCLKT